MTEPLSPPIAPRVAVRLALRRAGVVADDITADTDQVQITFSAEEWAHVRKLLLWGASEEARRRQEGTL